MTNTTPINPEGTNTPACFSTHYSSLHILLSNTVCYRYIVSEMKHSKIGDNRRNLYLDILCVIAIVLLLIIQAGYLPAVFLGMPDHMFTIIEFI